jgi:parallel beta-helix repeat protein
MATYYVDSVSGLDTNSGLTTALAWKTITPVNAKTFSPGDNVLFKRGCVWNYVNSTNFTLPSTGLVIKTSGTSGSPITWGAYGTGANPLFSGFVDTATIGWVRTSPTSDFWTYTDSNLPAIIYILTIDGVPQGYGRFPKSGYNTFTSSSVTPTFTITDPSLPNSPSFVNGEVVIRKSHSTLTRDNVVSQLSGTITYSGSGGTASPTDGNGYFFQNHLSCLSQFGDWCYDSTNKKITMYWPSPFTVGTGPTGVKVSLVDALISSSGTLKNYNTIENISFEGGNSYGISLAYGSTNNSVNNCTFNNMGVWAIALNGGVSCTITNNSITDTMGMGIIMNDGNTSTISYNTINRCGQIPGMVWSTELPNGHGMYVGIKVGNSTTTTGCTLNNNTLLNIGSSGISTQGDTFKVNNNYIDTFCNVMDDAGGIYTTVNGSATYSQRTILNNIVVNGIGAPLGTKNLSAEANGIYCDDNSSNILIDGNSVAQCGYYGVFLHDTEMITLTNNLIFNNATSQLTVSYDNISTSPSLPGNINYNNNIFISTSNSQVWIWFRALNSTWSSANDYKNFGSFDNNIYLYHGLHTALFTNEFPAGSYLLMNFATWQTNTAKDINSAAVFYSSPYMLPGVFSRLSSLGLYTTIA